MRVSLGFRCVIAPLDCVTGRSRRVALPQVRIAAGETLVAIASLIRKEDLGPRVLTIVLQLAHDDEHEDLRMTAVRVPCLLGVGNRLRLSLPRER